VPSGAVLATVWVRVEFTERQLIEADYILCGNLSVNTINSTVNWGQFQRVICAEKFLEDESGCNAKCLVPCKEYSYTTSISTASWPSVSSQVPFYTTFIQGQDRYGIKFDKYEIVKQYALVNKSASQELLLKLDAQRLISKNFLQHIIQFDSRVFNQEMDTVAMPLELLGAQIGCVLSLWFGVTIIVLFEVLEQCLSIFSSVIDTRKKVKSITIINIKSANFRK